MKVLIFLCLATLVLTGSVAAQKKSKKPVIRATVTVKGDGSFTVPVVPAVVPNETDSGVWKLIEVPEHRMKIEVPLLDEENFEETYFINMVKVWNYSAETKKATYRLMVRDFAEIIDNRDIEQTLNETIESVYRKGHPALKVKKKIYYGDRLGMEILTEEKKKVNAARFYILNGKLFALYVTVRSKAHWLLVEPWAQKFFNSFAVEVPEVNRA